MGDTTHWSVHLSPTFPQIVWLVVSPLNVVSVWFPDSWISVGYLFWQLRIRTGSFPVWSPGGCSVANTWFCGWIPLDSDIWPFTFVMWVSWVYRTVESFLTFFKLCWFIDISRACCQPTSETGGSFVVLVVFDLSYAASEWRRGVASLNVGLQLEHSHLNCSESFSPRPDSVLPVVCPREAVYQLRLLQSNISL